MVVYTVTRSIFEMSGKTWASELLYHNTSDAAEDDAEALKLKNDYTESFFRDNMHALFDSEKKVYIRLGAEMLKRNVSDCLLRGRSVIEVTPSAIADKEALAKLMSLKRRGYTIAFSPMLYRERDKELFDFCDIARFSVNADPDRIKKTVAACREADKLCIADDVETAEDFEFADSMGVDLISGYFFARPIIEIKKSGKPMVKTFLQVVALLYSKDPDIEQIAAIISTDPVLTIRLLKLINQMCAESGNTISTVHQALVMLGLDKLKEWIYLVGLQRLNRDAPSELLKLALSRASFCENLAKVTPGVVGKAKELYLMGLISIITGTNGPGLAEELKELPVSKEIKDGLMGEEGLYNNIFRMAYSYERADWANADKYAKLLHIDDGAVNMVYKNSMAFMENFKEISGD